MFNKIIRQVFIKSGFEVVFLLIVGCSFLDTNPLDPNGKNYVPPSFSIKTEGENVGDGDTIHRTSARLYVQGNRKECRFQVQLNDGDTSQWQNGSEFVLKLLSDGQQQAVVKCKYAGGKEIVTKTINFTVVAEGFIPKFSSMKDSLVLADTFQMVKLSTHVSGVAPISFQWYKDSKIINGQTQNVLIIEHFNNENKGVYYCVAINEYDTVRGPLITLAFGSSITITYDGNGNTSGSVPFDATSYNQGTTITVKGNVNNLVKAGYSFAGWSSQKDGEGTIYSAGAEIQNVSSNVILYA
ncbi:MAG TPA: InlB B-repeat-containing protein, partial [Chitinispirillaceae bacterium]|nr:InlB B-repeat-containing protein [Chitinispirillaceae bacterium]